MKSTSYCQACSVEAPTHQARWTYSSGALTAISETETR